MNSGLVAGALAGLLLGLGGWSASEPPWPATSCQESCYQAKSVAYQHCRSLPPADRSARLACFKEADRALKRCLSSCQ